MKTEPKSVRLARAERELEDTASRLQLAVSCANWRDARVHAERAADLEREIAWIKAEPDQVNVVGRPRVQG